MTPERHQQIKRLFLAACELSQEQRSAFLEQPCAEDPDLRREVESLLAHHLAATLLETETAAKLSPEQAERIEKRLRELRSEASAESATAEPARFSAGTMLLDRYRIVHQLGRGGMGEVYRADDLKLDQSVALKFIAPGRTQDAKWLARFYNPGFPI